jgi:DNA-binding NarL/FixJ family response regulator
VLVLTTYETDRDVPPAIKAGATGYLLKDATQQELFRAVGAAARASRSSRRRSRAGSLARSVGWAARSSP